MSQAKAAPKKKVAAKKTATKAAPKKKSVAIAPKRATQPPKKSSIAPRSDRRSSVNELKAEEHKREEVVLGGWPAGVTTYRIGGTWYCKIDNVSPGATVARAHAASRDEAVSHATTAATRRLAATRVHR